MLTDSLFRLQYHSHPHITVFPSHIGIKWLLLFILSLANVKLIPLSITRCSNTTFTTNDGSPLLWAYCILLWRRCWLGKFSSCEIPFEYIQWFWHAKNFSLDAEAPDYLLPVQRWPRKRVCCSPSAASITTYSNHTLVQYKPISHWKYYRTKQWKSTLLTPS